MFYQLAAQQLTLKAKTVNMSSSQPPAAKPQGWEGTPTNIILKDIFIILKISILGPHPSPVSNGLGAWGGQ